MNPLQFAQEKYGDDPVGMETFLAEVVGRQEMNPNRSICSCSENPARCEFKMSATIAKHVQNLKGTNEIPEAPLIPNSTGLPTLTNGKVPIASRYFKGPDGSWQRGFITKANNEYTIPGVIT